MDDRSIITEVEGLRDAARRRFELSAKLTQYTKEGRLDEWKKEFEEVKNQPLINDYLSVTKPLIALLSQHPIFRNLPSSRFFGPKQLLLSPQFQTHNLLRVAVEQNAEAAVAWLHRVAVIETTDLRFVTEVHGLETDEQHTLRNAVTLMPLDNLPPSTNARIAVAQYKTQLPGETFNFIPLPPIAATLFVSRVPARLDPPNTFDEVASLKLRRTIMAFTLASKHAAPVPGTSWIEFADPDLARAENRYYVDGRELRGHSAAHANAPD